MKFVIVTVVAFSAGWLLQPKAPVKTIFLKPQKITQEIRDSYFRRCSSDQLVARQDGTVEQMFTCPKGNKFFLVKRTKHQ